MSDLQQGIVPHLVVDDAAAAIEFYKAALSATEAARMPAKDGKRLMHAPLEVNGAKLLLGDDFPEFRTGSEPCPTVEPPTTAGRTTVVMHLDVPDCDAAVARATAAGAKVILAPMDAFWGARYAQIADPFGHVWSFAHPTT